MRRTTIPIDVYVLEDSDVKDLDDAARVNGTLSERAKEIAKDLPPGRSVQAGLKTTPRGGTTGTITVDGVLIRPGEGVAFHPNLPGGSMFVDAILLEEEEEEEVEDPEPPTPAPAAKKAAKKATKKAA